MLLGTPSASMVVANYLNRTSLRYNESHPEPAQLRSRNIDGTYTTWLNVIFLVIAAALVVRFITSGGLPMLLAMGGSRMRMTTMTYDDHLGH